MVVKQLQIEENDPIKPDIHLQASDDWERLFTSCVLYHLPQAALPSSPMVMQSLRQH